MKNKVEAIKGGTVTSPQGFTAGAVEAAIKYKGRPDLGVLYSEKPAIAAAVFTGNRVKAAPVLVSMQHADNSVVRAVIANSGCANACTGQQGLKDAQNMAKLAADLLEIYPKEVLVASTGVIGTLMPMGRVAAGLKKLKLTARGGHLLEKAIMTTDTRPKEIAVKVTDATGTYIIGGIAKGAGMIHPDMATLLGFLATDARVDPAFLKKALKAAMHDSFNMITIDGDTSTNDMVSIIANGAARNRKLTAANGGVFKLALSHVCTYLARSIAADGEGATKLIEVYVEKAKTAGDARKIARTIAGSPLVKSAIHGNDPNWGRIVAAAGRSGAHMVEHKVDVTLQGVQVMKDGSPLPFDKPALSRLLRKDNVSVVVRMNTGRAKATAWGCDLSQDYVTINSDYTT